MRRQYSTAGRSTNTAHFDPDGINVPGAELAARARYRALIRYDDCSQLRRLDPSIIARNRSSTPVFNKVVALQRHHGLASGGLTCDSGKTAPPSQYRAAA
jgi:hypothetical protein